MSDNLSVEYAESIVRGIRDDVDNGTPFGLDPDTDEEMTAYDYLNDVLDIRYIINQDRSYHGAQLLLTYGGPNTWLDTTDGELAVYWGDKAVRYVPSAFTDYLNEALEELWNMGG